MACARNGKPAAAPSAPHWPQSLSKPASAQNSITVYNAQHASLTKAWAEAFTKETGIQVTLRQGSDVELANQIVQEGANSPADVFLTENSPGMALVDDDISRTRLAVVCLVVGAVVQLLFH